MTVSHAPARHPRARRSRSAPVTIGLCLAALAGAAHAADGYGSPGSYRSSFGYRVESDLRANVGVGLGTLVFKDYNGLCSQTCAATTNQGGWGLLNTQNIFITVGIGDAREWKGLVSNGAATGFVAENLDRLAHDIAVGDGETVRALAELTAIPPAERDAFVARLRDRFGDIFIAQDDTAEQIIARISTIMSEA